MENWKKALVVVAFLATIGGLVATQYIKMQAKMEFAIQHQWANVQYVVWDQSINTTGGAYMLEWDDTAKCYKVSLGVWSPGTNKTYAAVFGIVNVEKSVNLKIVRIVITDSSGTEADNVPIKIYLHGDEGTPCYTGAMFSGTGDSGTLYYDGTAATAGDQDVSGNEWQIQANTKGYVQIDIDDNGDGTKDSTEYVLYMDGTYPATTDGDILYAARWDNTKKVWIPHKFTYDGTNSVWVDNGALPSDMPDAVSGTDVYTWVEIDITAPMGTTEQDYTGYVINIYFQSV